MQPTPSITRPAQRPRLPILLVAAAILLGLLGACTTPSGGGGGPTSTVPTDFARCPTPAAGQVRVATVVEGSGLAGFDQPEVVCVVVARGANGIVALNARAARLGVPPVRLNNGGLLCAIGGLPAPPACGEIGATGPQYWAYWLPNGTGGWSYAPVGPASRSMQEGTVEGWRWVPGGGATTPVHSSSFAALVTL